MPRGKPYKFCSRTCAVRGRTGISRRNRVVLNCKKCGRKYERKESAAGKSFYCSFKCLIADRDIGGLRNPNFKNAGWRRCEGCGSAYRSYSKTRRFCSALCGAAAQGEQAVANQRRGYDAELRCMEVLSDHGFIVFRSAASKGPFDVIAIGSGGLYLIQVKRTKEISRRRFPGVVRDLQKFDLPATANMQIWCWVDRTGWYVIDILRDGTTHERWMEDLRDYQSKCLVSGLPVAAPSLGFSSEALQ